MEPTGVIAMATVMARSATTPALTDSPLMVKVKEPAVEAVEIEVGVSVGVTPGAVTVSVAPTSPEHWLALLQALALTK